MKKNKLSVAMLALVMAVGAGYGCSSDAEEGAPKAAGAGGGGDEGEGAAGGGGGAGGDDGSGGGSGALGGKRLVSGDRHTCAIQDDGVRCWGNNGVGQLGLGTWGNDEPTPKLVPDLTDVAQLALGGGHSCARFTGGSVKCWGGNDYARLGDVADNQNIHPVPVPVESLTGAVEIALGHYHSCARFSDGSAQCWGDHRSGKLGDGTTDRPRRRPMPVPGLTDVVQLALGDIHSCALLSDGTVKCWGGNVGGQIGDGTSGRENDKPTPTLVSGLTDVVEIAAGWGHSCARLSDGRVKCWGENERGQLGDGGKEDGYTPTLVSGLTGAVELALGMMHACARLQDGSVECWGYSGYGVIGGVGVMHATPTKIPGLTDVVEIAAGSHHSCALLSDASIKCWGWNDNGQLGDGTTENKSTPTPVVW